ncbi:hypothetical protein [Citrobacter portucalensis]|uniref:hypothetical protein n=1 Tax=Citrobacter portucalensis TaxID=1639133 RepID=UPI00226B1A06|nr:hypothetical protein [Citrobacter portucalensis]MCX8991124.1 hypothetical protein [Citrobacter portucalensis]HBK4928361.1 hypothetical protein [Citrobacter freundii]
MKNKPTSINIDPAELAAADEAARAAGLSRSAWIVAAIRYALASGAPLTEATNVTGSVSNGADMAARVTEVEHQLALLMQQPAAPAPAAKPSTAAARRRLDTDPAAMAILMERYEQGIVPAAVATELNAAGYTTGGGKPSDKASVSETGYRARHSATKGKRKEQ